MTTMQDMITIHAELLLMIKWLIGLVALAIISPHLGKITKVAFGPLTAFFNGKDKKHGDDLES